MLNKYRCHSKQQKKKLKIQKENQITKKNTHTTNEIYVVSTEQWTKNEENPN